MHGFLKRWLWSILAFIVLIAAFLWFREFKGTDETEIRAKVEAALTPTGCPEVVGPTYGSLRYSGPLIDTHYHIPAVGKKWRAAAPGRQHRHQ